MPRVLVADDDREMRSWVRLVLRRLDDATIVEARDGLELLALLQTAGPFDLLIADVRMPLKNGLHAVAEARAAGVTVPVLLLTGYAGDVPMETVDRLGDVVLRRKPIDAQALLDEATAFLGRHDGRAEP